MLKKPIGNSCIEVDGIENYNVTHLCSGHLDYRKNMEKVLEEIHFNS